MPPKFRKSIVVSIISILLLSLFEFLFLSTKHIYSVFSLFGKIFYVVGPVLVSLVISKILQFARDGFFPHENFRALVWVLTGIFLFGSLWIMFVMLFGGGY